jgi:hypothetical protein
MSNGGLSVKPEAAYAYEEIEERGRGLKVAWLCQRQIVVYVLEDTTPSTVDLWVQAITEKIMAWPEGRPYLAVQDYTSPRFMVTPYIRQRAKEIDAVRPDLKRYLAVITGRHHVSLLLAYTISNFISHKIRTIQMFYERKPAVDWLLERQRIHLQA